MTNRNRIEPGSGPSHEVPHNGRTTQCHNHTTTERYWVGSYYQGNTSFRFIWPTPLRHCRSIQVTKTILADVQSAMNTVNNGYCKHAFLSITGNCSAHGHMKKHIKTITKFIITELTVITSIHSYVFSVHYYAQMCVPDALSECHTHQICDQCVTETHKI